MKHVSSHSSGAPNFEAVPTFLKTHACTLEAPLSSLASGFKGNLLL